MQNDRAELCHTKKQKIKQELLKFISHGNLFFTPLWYKIIGILEEPCSVCKTTNNPKADE